MGGKPTHTPTSKKSFRWKLEKWPQPRLGHLIHIASMQYAQSASCSTPKIISGLCIITNSSFRNYSLATYWATAFTLTHTRALLCVCAYTAAYIFFIGSQLLRHNASNAYTTSILSGQILPLFLYISTHVYMCGLFSVDENQTFVLLHCIWFADCDHNYVE